MSIFSHGHRAHVQATRTLGIYLVASMPIALQAQEVDTLAPAVVRAKAEASFSSSLAGTIRDLPFDEGAHFKAGDVLVIFGCEIQKAEAEAATADYQAAQAEYNAGQALLSRGGTGKVQVAVLEARANAAQARQKLATAVTDQCEITAPYEGQIVEITVNEFEYVQPYQPLLNIISSDTPELEISAPAAWLQWIEFGSIGSFSLNEKEEIYKIRISTVGAAVDPISDTIKLTAEFTSDVASILPGMSGLAAFE